ncbi:dolichyl-phosphate beta-glucosyltransferase [Physocladia obscura]|uniref:dolichyl-phosphate beta-glucosyltransferase n=1 Tax=Physocladia obscura TaxID=109957 RepID=A0AAD5SPZ1_9FUNG|nr:dolichyl-phosphate beta-glucosyltransferase [Physocladia obscura]
MRPQVRERTESERYYQHPLSGEVLAFPEIGGEEEEDEARGADRGKTGKDGGKQKRKEKGKRPRLSVVVPAFNEAARLPAMLTEALGHLAASPSHVAAGFELIVVDDGSRDDTAGVARRVACDLRCHDHVRVMVLERNRGKGGAGMLVARGDLILFADADGATKFADIDKLVAELETVSVNGFGVAVGSRAHMVKSAAVVKRSFIRNFLMYAFHTFLLLLGISKIKDTQCGFKMFTRDSVRSIFPNMHVEGWIFDIEILLLATWLNMPIVEVPVTWSEIDGSKVDLIKDSIKMAIDLITIRFYYAIGLWHIKKNSTGKTKKE